MNLGADGTDGLDERDVLRSPRDVLRAEEALDEEELLDRALLARGRTHAARRSRGRAARSSRA